jgi:cell wall-associated NlpC family hydrolase
MAFSGVALAYSGVGGLLIFSGIKGSTIADTAKALLSGNLSVSDTEQVNFSGSGSSGSSVTGSQILSDAQQYSGHKYVYGGPSNPTGGWDCSSFVSYVLGHDLSMQLPGGQTWAQATSNGSSHGPVADQFVSTPGFSKVGTDLSQIQAGDLLVWSDHVGFGVSPSEMFSAYDTASGTLQTGIQGSGSFIGIYRVQSGQDGSGSASNSASANQALAKQIIEADSAYSGWDTGQNWTDLVQLWTQESGWSATADNASSGAYGIAQALPASKYPAAGQKSGGSDPATQIKWGLSYIKSRYGSPVLAWAHEQSNNWY